MQNLENHKSMKWSWKLARIAGVDVYLHATFLLLIGWVMLSHWLQGRSLAATLAGSAFMAALFACLLLHELGHALAARRYGIGTRDITLLPIGGMARLERMPEDPRQELWVALAGPAVNVAIAAALLGWLLLRGALEPVGGLTLTGGSFAERLLVANVFLVLFNLLPAFPMDGGRVLRALLASRMEYPRATAIAAALGQGMAFLLGFAGLFWNPFLMFIALFVWIGAAQESAAVQMRTALRGVPIGQAMMTDFRTLSPREPLARAVDLVLSGSQQDFPVVDGGRVVGILTRSDLLIRLAERGHGELVGEAMRLHFDTVDASEMLESALVRLHQSQSNLMPVVKEGRLAGVVTSDNLAEYVMIQAALNGELPEKAAA
jgi:Zn-dependent protease